MKRVYFATSDEEGGPGQLKPRLAVLVEMAGGQAAALLGRKKLGEAVKRAELLRGFERPLPDGKSLRVQAFPLAPTASAPASAPGSVEELPLFEPRGFEPYRVRAWIGGRELREVVGQAGREEARLALVLLLLVGLSEAIWGARLLPLVGFTRLLVTGPVFLLGALGVWRRWRWSVNAALVVAIADTLTLVLHSAQDDGSGPFFFTIVARLALISTLWRLRKSDW